MKEYKDVELRKLSALLLQAEKDRKADRHPRSKKAVRPSGRAQKQRRFVTEGGITYKVLHDWKVK